MLEFWGLDFFCIWISLLNPALAVRSVNCLRGQPSRRVHTGLAHARVRDFFDFCGRIGIEKLRILLWPSKNAVLACFVFLFADVEGFTVFAQKGAFRTRRHREFWKDA